MDSLTFYSKNLILLPIYSQTDLLSCISIYLIMEQIFTTEINDTNLMLIKLCMAVMLFVLICLLLKSILTNIRTYLFEQPTETTDEDTDKEKDSNNCVYIAAKLYGAFIYAETLADKKIILITNKFWKKNPLDSMLRDHIIDIDDSNNNFIRTLTHCDKDICLILHTDGGSIDVNDSRRLL